VQKVVPTLTSKSVEIYLSMAGAKQLGDTGFVLVSAGAVQRCTRGTILCCTMVLVGGATSEAGEEAGPPGPRGFFD
jgi:hypothetical protein